MKWGRKILKEEATFQENLCGCNVLVYFWDFFHGLHIVNNSRCVDLPQSHTINHQSWLWYLLLMLVLHTKMSFLCLLSLLPLHSTDHQSQKQLGHFSLSCLSELRLPLTVNPSLECTWPVRRSGLLFTSPNEPLFLALSCKAIFSICWMRSMTQAVWYGFGDHSKPTMHNSLLFRKPVGAQRDKRAFC